MSPSSSLLKTSIIVRKTMLVSRYLPRAAMSGYSTSSRHGNDPEVIERNKESLLRKHAKDSTEEPHWHEELASDAEAFVKSQRNEINVTADSISKLQETSKKKLDPKLADKRK
ncbi:hypothetical protein Q9L58_007101 [Maublancomyces gigas]|uniref:Uncharacterized protein n=1 Tax=Discina gigas TaxID=1032678 RepID=A0ABR3GDX4_9PEZI